MNNDKKEITDLATSRKKEPRWFDRWFDSRPLPTGPQCDSLTDRESVLAAEHDRERLNDRLADAGELILTTPTINEFHFGDMIL